MNDRDLILEGAELIAAYLDRQMSAEEQSDFLDRLDTEEDLYESFVETVRFRDEQGRRLAPVVEHSRSRAPLWAVPGAVAALLAVGVVIPFLLDGKGGLSASAMARALVERPALEAELDDGWIEHGWRRTRGLTPIASEVGSAFRVGVYAIDLEVALRLERLDDARQLTRGIQFELRGVDFSEPLGDSYEALRKKLAEGVGPDDASELLAEIEPVAADFLDIDFGYAFGKWAETGRLAALSGNERLLRSRAVRKTLGSIQEREWTEEVTEELELIAGTIEDRSTELDLAKLVESFTNIIDES